MHTSWSQVVLASGACASHIPLALPKGRILELQSTASMRRASQMSSRLAAHLELTSPVRPTIRPSCSRTTARLHAAHGGRSRLRLDAGHNAAGRPFYARLPRHRVVDGAAGPALAFGEADRVLYRELGRSDSVAARTGLREALRRTAAIAAFAQAATTFARVAAKQR